MLQACGMRSPGLRKANMLAEIHRHHRHPFATAPVNRSCASASRAFQANRNVCASSSRRKIYFATKNMKKLEEVTAMLQDFQPLPFEIEAVNLDLPEMQAEPEEVSKHKCRIAARLVGGAVLVDDTSLCCDALNGMPGPYLKWFLEKLGPDDINRMLAGFDDKTAHLQCIFAYAPGPDVEPVVFVGRLEGRIVPARGPTGSGWGNLASVFEPKGYDQTYAEMDPAVKYPISHRYQSLSLLRSYLLEHVRQ